MFNLPSDMLCEIYEFDSFKYDVWSKVMSQFLKGGFYRNTLIPYKYVKKQAWCCRRYYASGLRGTHVKLWLKNIKLYEANVKVQEK
jgi:hypothetical protein